LARIVNDWMERLSDDMQARLAKKAFGTEPDDLDPEDPFDRPTWAMLLAEETRPVLREAFQAAANLAARQLGGRARFNMQTPEVERFLREREQRFVGEVTEARWRRLKQSLTSSMQAGEGIDQMTGRVIDSGVLEELNAQIEQGVRFYPANPEAIARTEVIGAYNGGTLESFKQSGIVAQKIWLATIDDHTRDTHLALHGQTVPVDGDFSSDSGASGPAPGQMGDPAEDINCRCSMLAVLGPNSAEPEAIVGSDAGALE
jgi:SPP1 gp7 family putative phage head morphogenesis protein